MLRRSESKGLSSQMDVLHLEEFYDRFMKTSSSLESLRKLHHLLHNNEQLQLPEVVTIALVSTLSDNSNGGFVRDLCSLVLQESMPNDALNLQDLAILENTEFDFDILCQLLISHTVKKPKPSDRSICFTKLNRLLINDGIPFPLVIKSIQALPQIASSLANSTFPVDKLDAICRRLNSHLRVGNLRGSNATSLQKNPSEIVTILSAQNFAAAEQLLNVESFSSLRQAWDAIFNDKLASSQAKTDFVSSIIDYCLAVFEQSERSTLKPQDTIFNRACRVEALAILDRACTVDPRFVIRVFPIMRSIYDQSDDLFTSMETLKFMLNHSDQIAYVPITELERFFGQDICSELENIGSCYEVVTFLFENLERFNSMNTSPLCVWFPNIMKLLAWYPMTFSAEFTVFLPTFLRADTAVEVLHSILDLPCITAVLMTTLQKRAINPIVMQSLETSSSRAMLNFSLRKSSGSGETLDRLGELHKLLQPFCSHPRVLMAAQIVVPLLRTFFDVMHDFCEADLAAKLVPVILERTKKLLSVSGFLLEINQLFAEEILNMFRTNPKLIVENRSEIMEFLSTSGHMYQAMYNNLVWSVGKFASTGYHFHLHSDVFRSYYETLECVMYEHLGSFSPKTTCITLVTLVKLSSRSQDLVPRVLLCSAKVNQIAQTATENEWRAVSQRVEEIVSVLRVPNVASVVLSPSPNILLMRQHLDNMSLPPLWRAIDQMLSTPATSGTGGEKTETNSNLNS